MAETVVGQPMKKRPPYKFDVSVISLIVIAGMVGTVAIVVFYYRRAKPPFEYEQAEEPLLVVDE
jgi:hypothetical protein